MKILLDTHVLVWWMDQSDRLSPRAVKLIENPENQVLVSAVVGWELAIKVRLGKIKPPSLIRNLDRTMSRYAFEETPITMAEAVRAGLLPLHHHDPFDRLLAAQSLILGAPIVSADSLLEAYGVKRLW